nr:MAG: replication associated protein [Circoviridae sp.]
MRPAARPKRFRLQAKNIFLTWPQCEVSKEAALEFIKDVCKDFGVSYVFVARESHKDGNKHIHALVRLKEAIDTYDERFFDMEDKHPHIEVARNIKSVITYLKKENDTLEWGDRPACAGIVDKKIKQERMLRDLQTKTIHEIMLEGEYTVYEMNAMMRLKQYADATKRVWPQFRKRHVLWYWGPTGSGKTRAASETLQRECPNDWIPITGDCNTFFNGYDAQKGVLFDDFRAGTMRFNVLLQILDGYRVMVNVKGSVREWNAEWIIITSSGRPEDIFYNHQTEAPWDNLDQLQRRLDEVIEFPRAEFELQRDEEPSTIEGLLQQECYAEMQRRQEATEVLRVSTAIPSPLGDEPLRVNSTLGVPHLP